MYNSPVPSMDTEMLYMLSMLSMWMETTVFIYER